MTGVVAQWNQNYGFVHLQDGRRAFAHKSDCLGGPLCEGLPVTAIVIEDMRNPGKWSAQKVKPAAGLAPVSRLAAGAQEEVIGVVSEWGQGYGFVSFPDGRRAFIHHTATG